MAARKAKTPPKQFMILDPNNESCCGDTFPTYDAAMEEARSHADGYGSSGDELTWKIVQVVGELDAVYEGITLTERKV